MIDPVSLGKLPETAMNTQSAGAKGEARGDLPNFEKLMEQSNADMREQRAKEAASTGDGEIRLGETKSDKEFRESLEKITGKKQDPLKNKMNSDDYLNLMVTQMRYQDPTKPMENQEMATQMAQFNSVEQLLGINKLLTQMNNAQSEMRSEKLTQYLGTLVEADSSVLQVRTGKPINSTFFDLPSAAGSVAVSIKDSAGKVVRSLALGTQEAGHHKIPWDGKDEKGIAVPSGQYTFSLEATSVDGKPVKAKVSILAKVEGVASLHEGGKLETAAGKLDLKQIVAVRSAEWERELAATDGAQGKDNTSASPKETTATPKNSPAQATTPAQGDPTQSNLPSFKEEHAASKSAVKPNEPKEPKGPKPIASKAA